MLGFSKPLYSFVFMGYASMRFWIDKSFVLPLRMGLNLLKIRFFFYSKRSNSLKIRF